MPRKKAIKSKKEGKKIVSKTTVKKVIKEEIRPRKKRSYIYSVGRRKTSVARVRLLKNGEGRIIINEKDYKEYFPYFEFQDIVGAPLKAVGKDKDFNFSIKVHGGGIRGQAEACRHGISRALIKVEENLKQTLRPEGLLTRDPRMKERKKPGLKRARRAPQWQKR